MDADQAAGNAKIDSRLKPVDALRGLIIILMALDHANYFIAQRHPIGEHWGGAFPEYNGAAAFLTRFVTHLSAPGFFFLMGIGMVLFSLSRFNRGWSRTQVLRHFLLRGSVLILLQFFIVNPIWKISPIPFPDWYQGVLVALGGTMIIAAFLLRFNAPLLLGLTVVISVVIEATHPDPSMWGLYNDTPLGLVFGFSGGDQVFWVNYPVLAWLEFVTFGMVFGYWLRDHPERTYRRALVIGLGFLLAFVVIRLLNGFGNIRPIAGSSWIDFLNVVKYPPSWSFTFVTMGLNLILLSFLDWLKQRTAGLVDFLAAFGRVPLFLYLTHLLLYALMGSVFTPSGSSYALMYLFWAIGLMILYPSIVWYGRKKADPALRPYLQYL